MMQAEDKANRICPKAQQEGCRGEQAGADILPLSHPMDGAGGKTGSWRFMRPVLDESKCINCLLCWIHCPDAVIDRDTLEIDLEYCKGCGICAEECPKKAITMVREEQNR